MMNAAPHFGNQPIENSASSLNVNDPRDKTSAVNSATNREKGKWDQICEFWQEVGVFTRVVIYTTLLIFVIQLFIERSTKFWTPFNLLGNFPRSTIVLLNFWRLITAPFVCRDPRDAILGAFLFLLESSKKEKERGTILLMMDFVSFTLQTQLLFCIGGIIYDDNNELNSASLLSIFLVFLSKRCSKEPLKAMKWSFVPVELPAILFPLIFLVLLSLASWAILSDLMAAMIVGVLNCIEKYPKVNQVQEKVLDWEEFPGFLHLFVRNQYFKSVTQATDFRISKLAIAKRERAKTMSKLRKRGNTMNKPPGLLNVDLSPPITEDNVTNKDIPISEHDPSGYYKFDQNP